jgi:hypothetical protein
MGEISVVSLALRAELVYASGVVGVTLQALDEAVNGLELGLDGDELVACQRAADRLSAKLGVAYGEFDALELWDVDAATSMTAWLREFSGLAGGEATRVLRSARRLRGLPSPPRLRSTALCRPGRCGPSWPTCRTPPPSCSPSTRPS